MGEEHEDEDEDESIQQEPMPQTDGPKMPHYAGHYKHFVHLRALYEQGYARNEFSECIEECGRSLEYAIAPYWRIKIFCILVGCYPHAWYTAEVSIISLDEPSRRSVE